MQISSLYVSLLPSSSSFTRSKSFSKPLSRLSSCSMSFDFCSTTSSKSSGVRFGSSSWFFCTVSSSIICQVPALFSPGFVSLLRCMSVPWCSPFKKAIAQLHNFAIAFLSFIVIIFCFTTCLPCFRCK